MKEEEIIAPYLEANHNLTKKIDELREQANEAWQWKERFERALEEIKDYERRLKLKERYVVVGRKAGDSIPYVLQVVREERHDDGTQIEVLLP